LTGGTIQWQYDFTQELFDAFMMIIIRHYFTGILQSYLRGSKASLELLQGEMQANIRVNQSHLDLKKSSAVVTTRVLESFCFRIKEEYGDLLWNTTQHSMIFFIENSNFATCREYVLFYRLAVTTKVYQVVEEALDVV
jgi:hypothetical protein